MPKVLRMITTVVVLAAAGNVRSQEIRQDKPLVLEDEAVTRETIARLAGFKVQKLVLHGDGIDAGVIEQLRHLASIRTLELLGGRVSGQVARLQSVKGLVDLEFSGSLDGYDLQAIGALTQLERLKLPQNLTINQVGAREIGQLTKLKSLELYNVNLDDSGLREFSPLIHLEKLDLTHTRVTDEGLKTLAHMPKLKTLELYRHPDWRIKQQISNKCLATIGQLTELERLSLSGEIDNDGLPQLAGLRRLKHLDIMGTNITSDGLGVLKDLNIESLTLFVHQLGRPEHDGAALKKLKSLKSVWVVGKFDLGEAVEAWSKALPNISWGGHG